MALDFDPSVVGLSSQPFRLFWQENGKTRSHIPDYFVRRHDGTGVVVDVQADDRIEPQDAEAFAAMERACESVGWEFRRVGAMEAVRTANLRWLAGYRHPRCLHVGWATELQRVFREPLRLLEGTRLRRKVTQILEASHGADAPALPSERTFYRLGEAPV